MKSIRLVLLLTVLFASAACTQNNGYIGRLFGSWVLVSATLNGEEMQLPPDSQTYWSFQADIVRIILEQEYHYAESNIGTFEQNGTNILRLNFTYSDDNYPEGGGLYGAPQWLGFPEKGIFELIVADTQSDILLLTYIKSPTETYTYRLARTW